MTRLNAVLIFSWIIGLAMVAGCNRGGKGVVVGTAVDLRPGAANQNAPGAQGGQSKATVSGKARLGIAQNARTHVEVYEQTLAVTKELAELLASVKDEAAATAARPRFDELQDEAAACARRMQQLGPHKAGLGDPYLPDLKRYTAQLHDEWSRINADPAMKAALGNLRV